MEAMQLWYSNVTASPNYDAMILWAVVSLTCAVFTFAVVAWWNGRANRKMMANRPKCPSILAGAENHGNPFNGAGQGKHPVSGGRNRESGDARRYSFDKPSQDGDDRPAWFVRGEGDTVTIERAIICKVQKINEWNSRPNLREGNRYFPTRDAAREWVKAEKKRRGLE